MKYRSIFTLKLFLILVTLLVSGFFFSTVYAETSSGGDFVVNGSVTPISDFLSGGDFTVHSAGDPITGEVQEGDFVAQSGSPFSSGGSSSSGGGGGIVDEKAPTISHIAISVVSDTQAIISFRTDVAATGKVLYQNQNGEEIELVGDEIARVHTFLLEGLIFDHSYVVTLHAEGERGKEAHDGPHAFVIQEFVDEETDESDTGAPIISFVPDTNAERVTTPVFAEGRDGSDVILSNKIEQYDLSEEVHTTTVILLPEDPDIHFETIEGSVTTLDIPVDVFTKDVENIQLVLTNQVYVLDYTPIGERYITRFRAPSVVDSYPLEILVEYTDNTYEVFIWNLNVISQGRVTDEKGRVPKDVHITLSHIDESGESIPWNASLYNQRNPQFLASDGGYVFVVGEGVYQMSIYKGDRLLYTGDVFEVEESQRVIDQHIMLSEVYTVFWLKAWFWIAILFIIIVIFLARRKKK